MPQERPETVFFEIDDEISYFDSIAPEKNLFAAILLGALNDVKKSGEVGRSARRFFLSEDSEYVFSFSSICEHLGISRRQVLRKAGLLGSEENAEGQKAAPAEPAK